MRASTLLLGTLGLLLPSAYLSAQQLRDDQLQRLIEMPLKNIFVEYPNKTSHIILDSLDARLTPRELHPAFYGCFDWHSAVHSHWMLAEVLTSHPQHPARAQIIDAFDQHFTEEKMRGEAAYFDKKLAATYERTYGWAWLLKLSEQLHTLAERGGDSTLRQQAKGWATHLDILADKIAGKWKDYLPKMTYPTRIGTHSNSAFALAFAIDYARSRGDKAFEEALVKKARELHLGDKQIPATWEPNATDFFSPSLLVADLMTRILPPKEYARWLKTFFTPAGIDRVCEPVIISDLTDYSIVHFVGLSFTRSWCMARIAGYLPQGHPLRERLAKTAQQMLQQGMEQIFRSNYGGDHWLASFARYADQVLRDQQLTPQP